MRTHLLAAVTLAGLLACGDDGDGPRPSRVPAEGDAVIFQEVLDGTRPAAEGLLEIAWAGGWPIATSEGFLFATLDGGNGPYTLESPDGSFEPVELKPEAGVAWAIVPFAAPEGVAYRFLGRSGAPFLDAHARFVRFPLGIETAHVRPAPGGRFDRWPGLGDAAIPPRALHVWVPAEPPTHFLYTHDGQNLFNGGAAFGGWGLQFTAGPRTLVVGIDHGGPRRVTEYTHVPDVISGETMGGEGDAYADYVEQTVRPFVEARYGTPTRVGVMGSSLGGLISLHQLLRHPGSYDFVASLSGTVGWGSLGATPPNETILERVAALGPADACPLAATLYLDSGGGPGSGCVDADGDGLRDDTTDSADNYCENVQLKETLEALGCADRLTYVWAEDAPHSESAWRARTPRIFELFEAL